MVNSYDTIQLEGLLTTIQEDEEDYERSIITVGLSTDYDSSLQREPSSIFYRIWNHVQNGLCMYIVLLGFVGILIYICVKEYVTNE
jgi:hypothetical protein